MAEKKITRKVISKVPAAAALESKKAAPRKVTEAVEETTPKTTEGVRSKKSCFFCQGKNNPSYTDTTALKRFLTDRAKIQPALKTNLCSKHQRTTTRQIKYARHLALLPFIPKV